MCKYVLKPKTKIFKSHFNKFKNTSTCTNYRHFLFHGLCSSMLFLSKVAMMSSEWCKYYGLVDKHLNKMLAND